MEGNADFRAGLLGERVERDGRAVVWRHTCTVFLSAGPATAALESVGKVRKVSDPWCTFLQV